MIRKSGQSYILNMEGNIAWNSALDDDHQGLFEEFKSEEQLILDVYTAFNHDGIIQVTTVPHYSFQQEVFDAYDEQSIWDDGSISLTVNAGYMVNRPYFFPVIAGLDDYMWKITRKQHVRVKQGQRMRIYGIHSDRVLADAATAGASKLEYIAKMDIACTKGRH